MLSVAQHHLKTIELFGAVIGFFIGVGQAIYFWFTYVPGDNSPRMNTDETNSAEKRNPCLSEIRGQLTPENSKCIAQTAARRSLKV